MISDSAYIIVDMDGTLADCEHRRHFLDQTPPNWKEFLKPEHVAADPVVDPVRELVCAMARDYLVVICSARGEELRETTENWLGKHGVTYDELMLRATHDSRQDVAVKQDMLDDLIERYGTKPLFTVDDRQCVVDMWRHNGIVCLQAAPGDFDNKRPNPGKLGLMVGPSHAGKSRARSHWHLMKPRPTEWNFTWISSDYFRAFITGNHEDQTKNAQVFAAMRDVVKSYITNGINVIVDATNIRNKDRLSFVDCVAGDVEVTYYVVDRPLSDKLASLRPGFPEEVVKRHHDTFQSNLKDILAGDGRPNVTVVDWRE